MRLFLASLCLLLAVPASAGENAYLGAVVVSGASLTNFTTAAPFAIPPGAKLTVVCSAAVQYLSDATVVTTSGAGKGAPIGANTLFPTSVGKSKGRIVSGGTSTDSASIAFIGTGSCDIWLRDGGE
jgi:hypothetical protein